MPLATLVDMTFVRASRVRELLNLQREALSFRSDEQRQRDELIAGLTRLVGAEIGVVVDDPVFARGLWGGFRAVGGHNMQRAQAAFDMLFERRASSPLLSRMLDLPRTGTQTVRGKTVLHEREWYDSEYFECGIKPSGCDELMGAMTPLGGSAVLGINVARARGEAPFSEEDAAVLALFLESCGPLLRKRLTLAERFRLTPRQAEVVALLRNGASNKELAVLLECSPRTAEAHVAAVFQKCGVTTRAQLVAMLSALDRAP